MTEEQKLLLETISKELGGKIIYKTCISKHSEHQQIIIEYAKQNRQTHSS